MQLEGLAGKRRESWVLVCVIGVAAIGAGLLWGRSAPAQIAPPASGGPLSSPAFVEGALLVHVTGAVRDPGVYRFPDGARIADAIETAGGPRRDADLSALNLAEELVDGSRIEVPRRGEDQSMPTPVANASPSLPIVDLNTADQVALETIPGVGPVTALAILQQRDAIGRFESIDQLLDVDGIGPATLEAIRPYITL